MPTNRTPTTFYGPDIPTPDTVDLLYTVPLDKIAVVKLVIVKWDVDTPNMQLTTEGTPTDDFRFFVRNYPGSPITTETWMYLPLSEGREINAFVDTGSNVVTITGDLYDA